MDDAGLRPDSDSGGYPVDNDKDNHPKKIEDMKGFLAKDVPFDYNIPQLYGGWPLFYTGEYTETWDTQKFKGYFQCGTASPAPAPPGDSTLMSDRSCEKYNKYPLELVCNSLNEKTKLIPTFGGQYPVGGKDALNHIRTMCQKNYDGKSFISWNVPDPTNEEGSCKCDPQHTGCREEQCNTIKDFETCERDNVHKNWGCIWSPSMVDKTLLNKKCPPPPTKKPE